MWCGAHSLRTDSKPQAFPTLGLENINTRLAGEPQASVFFRAEISRLIALALIAFTEGNFSFQAVLFPGHPELGSLNSCRCACTRANLDISILEKGVKGFAPDSNTLT